MAKLYVNMITLGRLILEQVPEKWYQAVEALLPYEEVVIEEGSG